MDFKDYIQHSGKKGMKWRSVAERLADKAKKAAKDISKAASDTWDKWNNGEDSDETKQTKKLRKKMEKFNKSTPELDRTRKYVINRMRKQHAEERAKSDKQYTERNSDTKATKKTKKKVIKKSK